MPVPLYLLLLLYFMEPFVLVGVVGPFLWGYFFSCLRPQALACFA